MSIISRCLLGALLFWGAPALGQEAQEGWPIEYTSFFQGHPTLADFDNDGTPEVVVQNAFDGLFVYDHDGEVLDGWPWNDIASRNPDPRK